MGREPRAQAWWPSLWPVRRQSSLAKTRARLTAPFCVLFVHSDKQMHQSRRRIELMTQFIGAVAQAGRHSLASPLHKAHAAVVASRPVGAPTGHGAHLVPRARRPR